MEHLLTAMSDRELERFLARLPAGDLWVFGYGSLMWNPGFRYLRSSAARVYGYHRALCIDSTAHRGSAQRPGLVMGLAPGGTCRGTAFLVVARDVPHALAELWQREMCDGTYLARFLTIRIEGKRNSALAFVANRRHRLYSGSLPLGEIARRVTCCEGERGTNIDYLMSTFAHLHALGVHDRRLGEIVAAVRALGMRGEERTALVGGDEGLERI